MNWLSRILSRLHSKAKATRNSSNEASNAKKEDAVQSDNPIRQPKDDRFGRNSIARSFAEDVLALDASEGVVIGILGAWGSGKTSFINLARPEFHRSRILVLDFNPWMFSGTEQLVEHFFAELAAQLKLESRFKSIAADLADYGESFSGLSWIPVLGPWIQRGKDITKVLNAILRRRKEGVTGRRKKLEEALGRLEHPIIVVLDDIDRLSSSEIRDVFKLVRLIASFPNVIYILAFDRLRVERALYESGVPGRDYLEKILQLAVDLPAMEPQILRRQLTISLDEGISQTTDPAPFSAQRWPDVLIEIITPFVRNMRDVRRYVAGTRTTIRILGGQVELVDVLALEAIRTFLPDVYSKIYGAIDGLTTPSSESYGSERPTLKATIEDLLKTDSKHEGVVRAMIERLFPAAVRHIDGSSYGSDWTPQWLRERRVAHKDILRVYCEQIAGEGLRAFNAAEKAFQLMSDRTALDAYLRTLDAEQFEDVIASLEVFEKDFSPDRVVPGIVVLLNLLPDLPEKERGMYSLESSMVVGRVTFRLIRSLGAPDRIEKAVGEILPQINSLSSKLELITDIGYREGAGHKLVSEETATAFERCWRDELRAATHTELQAENDLLRMLLIAKRGTGSDEPPVTIPNSTELTLAILKSSRHEVRSQGMGSRTVHRSTRLAWGALVEIFGSEEDLRRRIERLRETKQDRDQELMELVDKYLSGWKPGHFE